MSLVIGTQVTAARSLLRWTIKELSRRSRISAVTIGKIEMSGADFRVQVSTLRAVQSTMERARIVFLSGENDDSPGVQLMAVRRKSR